MQIFRDLNIFNTNIYISGEFPCFFFVLFSHMKAEFRTRKPDVTSLNLAFNKYSLSAWSTGQALF